MSNDPKLWELYWTRAHPQTKKVYGTYSVTFKGQKSFEWFKNVLEKDHDVISIEVTIITFTSAEGRLKSVEKIR